VVTQHRLTLPGGSLAYTATVGATLMCNDAGTPRASVWSFSYTRRSGSGKTALLAECRPVVFCFNGGPGSSSLYLHFGGFGPVRALVPRPEATPRTRGRPGGVPNSDSLLDVADLVFVDPPGTGLARVLGHDSADSVLGVQADAELMAAFVRRWLSAQGRWASPVYLMGQSYGALRVAAVARELMGSVGAGQLRAAAVDGLILIGQAVNLGLMKSELRHAWLLPTMAALAWQHGQTSSARRSLALVLQEAQEFALQRLAPALLQGSRLDPVENLALAEQLAGLTGIPAQRWADASLRLEPAAFAEVLPLAAGGRISLYDGRYARPLPVQEPDPVADDAMLTEAAVACHAALQAQLQGPLRCPVSDDYLAINFKVNGTWDWRHREPGSPTLTDFTPALTTSLNRHAGLRLFVASGAFDLVTPWGAAEHLVSRPGMPADRVQHRVYAAGHSPYLGDAPRAALAADLRAFLTDECAPQGPAAARPARRDAQTSRRGLRP
jgi:carboxypeptidase C (cathepsin A)